MYCMQCGKKIEDGEIFCSSCGMALNVQEKIQEKKKNYSYKEKKIQKGELKKLKKEHSELLFLMRQREKELAGELYDRQIIINKLNHEIEDELKMNETNLRENRKLREERNLDVSYCYRCGYYVGNANFCEKCGMEIIRERNDE